MDYISIIINVTISTFIAIITARLTINGFYKQEIWLRKEERYNSIINELSHMEIYFANLFDIAGGIPHELVDTELAADEYKPASYKLEVRGSMGGFIISQEVAKVLKNLMISSKNKTTEEMQGNYFAYYDRMCAEIAKAKEKVIRIANKDLKIKTNSLLKTCKNYGGGYL